MISENRSSEACSTKAADVRSFISDYAAAYQLAAHHSCAGSIPRCVFSVLDVFSEFLQ
jgi:hypothetical protein